MSEILKVRCPICTRMVARTHEEFPFCSNRCRTIDLGNWASEKYVISSPLDHREILEHDPSDQHDEE